MASPEMSPTVASSVTCDDAWWRQWEPWLLTLLVVIGYLLPLNSVPIRGEEPRRAQVAREMIASGDLVVPRYQDQLFLSRPPLQNWLIVGLGRLRGAVDETAVRLPSVLALWLTALLVFYYGRRFLSRIGALAAAIGLLTMGQVLELGRTGETEALFTLLVAASLLVWHAGAASGPPRLGTWLAAYTFVALGMLTKGLQAPAYFAAAVGLYLLVERRGRELLHWQHLAGILTFLIIWGSWQAAYLIQEGWQATRAMYWNDVAMRFEDRSWKTFVEHLATYPLEVLACMLPWSGLLLPYLNAGFRRTLAPIRREVLFLAICLLVTFPTCWLVQGAKGRYYMPLFPCVALLIGVYVDQLSQPVGAAWRKVWSHFNLAVSAAMLLAAIGALLLAAATAAAVPFVAVSELAAGIPWWLSLTLAASSTALGVVVFRNRQGDTPARLRLSLVSIAAFVALLHAGLVVRLTAAGATPTQRQVAELKQRLPQDPRLVSYGMVDPVFLYHFGAPIERRSRDPRLAGEDGAEYFCISSAWGGPPPDRLPFDWQMLGTVSCERTRQENPQRVVWIGRRLPAGEGPPRTANRPAQGDYASPR